MIKDTKSVIISFNECDDPDDELLVIGARHPMNTAAIDIINAIQGPKARELWERLTIKESEMWS